MRKTFMRWIYLSVSAIIVISLIASVFLLRENNSNDNETTSVPDSQTSVIVSDTEQTSSDFAESDMEVIAKPQLNIPNNIFGDVPFVGLYEAETLEPIYEQSATSLMYPASMTKIVTASVALKYVSPDDIVKVGSEQDLVNWDSSKCGILRQ